MITKPMYLRSSDRRRATVQAVVALAASHNPSKITTTAIAHEMGVTQGAVFRHFATRDAILQAVMEWVAGGLMSRVDAAVQATAWPMLALEALFMAHLEFVTSHLGVPRILLTEFQRAKPTKPKRMAQVFFQRYGGRDGVYRVNINNRKAEGVLRTNGTV